MGYRYRIVRSSGKVHAATKRSTKGQPTVYITACGIGWSKSAKRSKKRVTCKLCKRVLNAKK